MYIKVNQISNDLFDDRFEIVDENNNKVGDASLSGSLGSREANIVIDFMNNNIILKFGYKDFGERLKGMFSAGIFRPYNIIINNSNKGRIFLNYVKESFFSRTAFHEMQFEGKNIKSYYYGLKENGEAYSIYEEDKLIGQFLKPAKVIDGLNNYEIKTIDSDSMMKAIIDCLYTHTLFYYRPGEKITSGEVTHYSNTFSKFLEDKYNSDFWNNN